MISPGLTSCEHSLNTLRYADRVKELAADPMDPSNKGSQSSAGVGTISPLIEEDGQDDDLAQLRSLNVRYFFLTLKDRCYIMCVISLRRGNCPPIYIHSTKLFHIYKKWKKTYWILISLC